MVNFSYLTEKSVKGTARKIARPQNWNDRGAFWGKLFLYRCDDLLHKLRNHDNTKEINIGKVKMLKACSNSPRDQRAYI